MNCITHNQEPAVSTCNNCSVGLCSTCVREAFKIDNKALCKECTLSTFDNILNEFQQELGGIKFKKIIWTIILALGIIVGIFMFIDGLEHNNLSFFSFVPSFFIWGLAGFWDRQKRKIEYENSKTVTEATRDGIMERDMYNNGSIFIVWIFKLFIVVIRGIFFPIFYIIFMISGENKILKNIENLQARKAFYENYTI